MDNQHKIDVADTGVQDDPLASTTDRVEVLGGFLGREGATSAIRVREARTLVEEIIEGESATVEHRYQPPSVSWTQRVLNWFRRS